MDSKLLVSGSTSTPARSMRKDPATKTQTGNHFHESEQVDAKNDPEGDYTEAVAFAFEGITGTLFDSDHSSRSVALPATISDSGASHSITCDANILSNVQTNEIKVKHIGGFTKPSTTATVDSPSL
mmetsp:Transcript_32320/g.63207  ORF Transcript_32320/g.63207 Transcript_32320/m.63207 type:complete len:126 (+) Transcript_32320:68-445(+)